MEETILIPREDWMQGRFNDVCTAIAIRYKRNEHIPIEWIEEYNELRLLVKTVDATTYNV